MDKLKVPRDYIALPRFPEHVQAEADAQLFWPDEVFNNRSEATGVIIDTESAKISEDAIDIEYIDGCHVLSVTVPDPSAAMTSESEVFMEGMRRFMPYHSIQGWMGTVFPQRTREALSLHQEEDRPVPTITYVMHIDANMNLKQMEVKRTRVQSLKRMNYAQAKQSMSSGGALNKSGKNKHLKNFANRFYKWLRAEGMPITDDLVFQQDTTNGAAQMHMIVKACMMYTNFAVAEYSRRHGLKGPFVNRICKDGSFNKKRMQTEIGYLAKEQDAVAKLGALRTAFEERLSHCTVSGRPTGDARVGFLPRAHATRTASGMLDAVTAVRVADHHEAESSGWVAIDPDWFNKFANHRSSAVTRAAQNEPLVAEAESFMRADTAPGVFLKLNPMQWEFLLRLCTDRDEWPPHVIQGLHAYLEAGGRINKPLAWRMAGMMMHTPTLSRYAYLIRTRLSGKPMDIFRTLCERAGVEHRQVAIQAGETWCVTTVIIHEGQTLVCPVFAQSNSKKREADRESERNALHAWVNHSWVPLHELALPDRIAGRKKMSLLTQCGVAKGAEFDNGVMDGPEWNVTGTLTLSDDSQLQASATGHVKARARQAAADALFAQYVSQMGEATQPA